MNLHACHPLPLCPPPPPLPYLQKDFFALSNIFLISAIPCYTTRGAWAENSLGYAHRPQPNQEYAQEISFFQINNYIVLLHHAP